MVPAPDLAALAQDVLWCLGLGLLLAAARDALGLLLGSSKPVCILLDVLMFANAAFLLCGFAAGVSATGVVRWYMLLATAAGAMAWSEVVSRPVHAFAWALLRVFSVPLRAVSHHFLRPLRERLLFVMRSGFTLHQNLRKNAKKRRKRGKKQLQKQRQILYN